MTEIFRRVLTCVDVDTRAPARSNFRFRQSNTMACHNTLQHNRPLATHLSHLKSGENSDFSFILILEPSTLLCRPLILFESPQRHSLHHCALSFAMAGQAPTLTSASLKRERCPCNNASFAMIVPSNDLAKIEAAFLAEQKYNGSLPESHGRFFHAKESPSENAHTPSDSDSESEAEDVDRKLCESHYALNLDDLSPITSLMTFRMGSGALDASEEESDAEFLTGCPGRPSQRVAPVHCGFTFGTSGACLIKALSSTLPTIIFINNEPVTLNFGETHLLCYRTNRFTIGNLEYNFVYNRLGDEGYATFNHQRKAMFEKFALPLPDRRLWSISAVAERLVIGPAIMQACAGRDEPEGELVGIHLRTGDSLAVKPLAIGPERKLEEISTELQILLSFPVCATNLNTSPVNHTDHLDRVPKAFCRLSKCDVRMATASTTRAVRNREESANSAKRSTIQSMSSQDWHKRTSVPMAGPSGPRKVHLSR